MYVILQYKIFILSTITTFAFIGNTRNNCSFFINQIAKIHKVLLFENSSDEKSENIYPHTKDLFTCNIEFMNCATNASWEADIIILSAVAEDWQNIASKIKEVSTGKIVIIISDDNNQTDFKTVFNIVHPLLPHSFIIQILKIDNKKNNDDLMILNANNEESLSTISSLFTEVGIRSISNFVHIYNN